MIVKKIFKTTSSLILVSQLFTSVSFPNKNVCFAGAKAEDGGDVRKFPSRKFYKRAVEGR